MNFVQKQIFQYYLDDLQMFKILVCSLKQYERNRSLLNDHQNADNKLNICRSKSNMLVILGYKH